MPASFRRVFALARPGRWSGPSVSVLLVAVTAAPVMAQTPGAEPPARSAEPPAAEVRPLGESLSDTAKHEYEAGRLLYSDGDFASALVKFGRAYEVSHDARLLWNMATCEKNLRHYAKAQVLLDRYLAEGASLVTAEDTEQARAFLQAIEHFISELTISVDQTGAAITVDEEPAGTSPLAKPLRVDMGQRKIRVHKHGFRDYTTVQSVTGATKTELKVVLVPEVHEGTLRIVTEANYRVFVDGQPVTSTGTWQAKLASGVHTVRVTGPGKTTYQGDALVQDGQTATMRVVLQNEPSARPEHKFPWLWVAGGTLLAAGLTVGGYFLLRPSEPAEPSPMVGSMAPGTVELPLSRY